MEYASNAKGNTGVTLGAIGTGLSALNVLGGLTGMANNVAPSYGYGYGGVSRGEIEVIQRLMASEQATAILAAAQETDRKLVDVYAKLESRDKEIWDRIEDMRRHQEDVNREQAVYNGVNTSQVALLKEQVKQLMGLTKVVIPNESISPGWDAT